MTAFPRSAGALPRFATPPKFPVGLQSWGPSGKGQVRSVKNMGRTWDEAYAILDAQNPSMRALVELINRSMRSGLVWDVQHPYWHFLKGVGGGSPQAFSIRQIIQAPEDFSQWLNLGTPTITTGQADPYGTTNATLIGDDDAAALEGKQLPTGLIPFTGNAVKTLAFFCKANTAPENLIELRDQTASVNRMACTITWQLGIPVISAVTGTLLRVIPYNNGWWRLLFQTTAVTAANAHTINVRIGPSVGSTGNTFFFGFNAWDAAVCGPYRGPSNLGPYALPTAQEGSELYVQAAPSSTVAWLRQGDLIDCVGSPVVLDVTGQVDTDAAGGAIIPISPPLFAPSYYIPHGTSIIVDPTAITFSAVIDKVQGSPAIDSTQYLDAGLVVSWREVAG